MGSNKTINIILCILSWLTISIVFPFIAKKYGLIKKRWLRILLTLISPAAIITYLLIIFFVLLGKDADFKKDDLPFKTKEEFSLLTETKDFPDFNFKSCWRDVLEGTVHANYSFNEKISSAFVEEIKKKCADKNNIYWSAYSTSSSAEHESFVFSRGWSVDYMRKPKDDFPDDISVTLSINEDGFSASYEMWQPYRFEGYSTPSEISERIGINFPSFEIVNYQWHRVGPDDWATMTILLNRLPSSSFLRDLETHFGKNDDGSYSWGDELRDEEGIPKYSRGITITPGSRIVTLDYNSY